MSITIDLSAVAAYPVNLETVEVRDQSFGAPETVAGAKRLMQGQREVKSSFGKYLGTLCDFRLPSSISSHPIPGYYVVTADGMAFVALKVDPPSTYNTTWKLHCQALMVFGDQVDWHPCLQTTDDYADRLTNSAIVPPAAVITCRIQPTAAGIVDQLGKRGFVNRFTVFMLASPDLHAGDLFIDQAGVQYKVVAWVGKQTIDSAMEVYCEVLP